MNQEQPTAIEIAQEWQDIWKDIAENFKDTPLYEGFLQLQDERLEMWENLEEVALRREERAEQI